MQCLRSGDWWIKTFIFGHPASNLARRTSIFPENMQNMM